MYHIEDDDLSLEAEVRRLEKQPLPKVAPYKVARKKRKKRYEKGVRHKAHEVFDQLWLSGKFDREGAYAWLRAALNKNDVEGHIGWMKTSECNELIRKVQRAFPSLYERKEERGDIEGF
jgi:hypothetical protein